MERANRGGTRNIASVSSLDDLEFQTKPGKFFPVQIPSVKETEPVTKRIGPTPPESGTTLKNVGKEPAQTRLRGKAIKEYEKVYPAPNQGHEATMADIANIKKQRQKSAEAAVTAERKARERKEKKVKRTEGRLRHGEPVDLPTETKPIVPVVDDVVDDVAPKAAVETAEDAIDKTTSATIKTTAGAVSDAIDKTKTSSTTKKIAESLDAAKNAVKGKANARNLLLAGAASIVGVSLYQRNRQTRIEPDEYYH